MFHNIIIDYEGVLANTDPFNLYAIGQICKAKDIPFSGDAYKRFFVSRTLKEGFSDFLASVGKKDAVEDCIAKKKEYDVQYLDHVPVYKDTLLFMAEAKRKHVLVLAANARKEIVMPLLAKYNLTYSFQLIITSEDFIKGKPDPDIYLTARQSLVTTPEEVLVVVGSTPGVEAAKAARLSCLAVTHTHATDTLRGADWIVDSLAKVNIIDLALPTAKT